MGASTKALLTNPPTLVDLLLFASEQYADANLRPTSVEGMFLLSFRDRKDHRAVYVFEPGACANDYADVHTGPAILMSMGRWGNSEAIARRFAVRFGGLVMPDDSTDDWQNVNGNPDAVSQ